MSGFNAGFVDDAGTVVELASVGMRFRISTLEGDLIVGPDDMVIRGVKGEIYPCKPDIFEATYEAA